MIDTNEYYGGTYPDPPEEDTFDYEDYDNYLANEADNYNDDMRMGLYDE